MEKTKKPRKWNEEKKWKLATEKIKEIPSVFNFVKKPLEAGLWCLYISKNKFGKDYLSAKEIRNILQDYLGIPIKEIKIIRAFARAGNKIIVRRTDRSYRIAWPGEEYLKSLKIENPLSVIYLAPNKPVTAESSLNNLIKSIKKGNLLITDPYYGLKTLKTLCEFAEYHKSVQFLTAQLGGGEKVSIVNNFLKDLKKEYKNKVEIRIYPNKNELHDRYILSQDIFFIIGQGLKDLGNKESLIVGIEDKYGKDIRKILEKAFCERWDKSQIL
jgi:hypothetical protein